MLTYNSTSSTIRGTCGNHTDPATLRVVVGHVVSQAPWIFGHPTQKSVAPPGDVTSSSCRQI